MSAVQRVRVFISYAPTELIWRDSLAEALSKLGAEVLDDARIEEGAHWTDALLHMLDEADASVLLISPEYLESHYRNVERLRALYRREQENLLVIPVIIKPSPVRDHEWLRSMQLYNLTPLAEQPDHEEAVRRLAERAVELVSRRRTEPAGQPEQLEVSAADGLGVEAAAEARKEGKAGTVLPRYHADDWRGRDLLGITRDVNALGRSLGGVPALATTALRWLRPYAEKVRRAVAQPSSAVRWSS